MHPILNIAVRAARRAGKTILHRSYRVDQLRYNTKTARDFVTDVDLIAEREIVQIIHDAYPTHAIVAEEIHSKSGRIYEWIIDPLDGTTNYMHAIPQYSVSIAVRRESILQHCVVYNPVNEELFTASRGVGAYLNERRIRVSSVSRLNESLLGTGFPFREMDNVELWIDIFREVSQKTVGVRRIGSAALDLAYVACGRFEGFWETGLNIWDMAAGVLLIQESGGLVCDFEGNKNFLETGMIMAANPAIYPMLQKIIKQKYCRHHTSN